MRIVSLCLLLVSAVAFSCQEGQTFVRYELVPIALESTNSGMPNLFTNNEGDIYLSWIEKPNDSLAILKYSMLQNEQWSAPRIISQGTNWFVNWADFPSIAQFPKSKQLIGHWLQKRAAGTYDYDVHLSISDQATSEWNPSFVPHRDSIAAEHGFVTLLPLPKGNIQAVWLDGRNTKTDVGGHSNGHNGAMTLRVAEVDQNGQLHEEFELDGRVCDCCQTDAAMSEAGPIVVYRDRSPSEIRDVALIRKVKGSWLSPQIIGQDQWEINGCPVNGPAITAEGKQIAVAWFTMAQEAPKVQVAFSRNAAATFGQPIILDAIDPIGRVDILFIDERKVGLTWIDDTEDGAFIQFSVVDRDGKILHQQAIAAIEPSRKSGFPILEKCKEGLVVAWTAVKGEQSIVKTAFLRN
ncbi:MAG: hypothetical protein AAF242_01570 [Bacteroidota bacterium]